jgi:hypothetical protein
MLHTSLCRLLTATTVAQPATAHRGWLQPSVSGRRSVATYAGGCMRTAVARREVSQPRAEQRQTTWMVSCSACANPTHSPEACRATCRGARPDAMRPGAHANPLHTLHGCISCVACPCPARSSGTPARVWDGSTCRSRGGYLQRLGQRVARPCSFLSDTEHMPCQVEAWS